MGMGMVIIIILMTTTTTKIDLRMAADGAQDRPAGQRLDLSQVIMMATMTKRKKSKTTAIIEVTTNIISRVTVTAKLMIGIIVVFGSLGLNWGLRVYSQQFQSDTCIAMRMYS
jgi:hypothetical protein